MQVRLGTIEQRLKDETEKLHLFLAALGFDAKVESCTEVYTRYSASRSECINFQGKWKNPSFATAHLLLGMLQVGYTMKEEGAPAQ
jgi:hypothetical protein